jgi:hypothetical protein
VYVRVWVLQTVLGPAIEQGLIGAFLPTILSVLAELKPKQLLDFTDIVAQFNDVVVETTIDVVPCPDIIVIPEPDTAQTYPVAPDTGEIE